MLALVTQSLEFKTKRPREELVFAGPCLYPCPNFIRGRTESAFNSLMVQVDPEGTTDQQQILVVVAAGNECPVAPTPQSTSDMNQLESAS